MRLSNTGTLPDCSKAHALASHTHLQPDRFVAQCPKVVSSVSSSPSHLCDTQELRTDSAWKDPRVLHAFARAKKGSRRRGKALLAACWT